MKKIYKIFMAVAAVAAVGCTTDATEDLGVNLNEGPTTLTLSLDDTRTQLGEKADGTYPLTWAENDAISVNGSVSKALTADEAGATSATFTFNNEFGSAPYFVAYPATSTNNQVVFAAEQTHTSNTTFGNGAAVMYGYTTDLNSVKLNHLTGVLKIGLVSGTATPAYIKEVRISTVDRKPIAGTFSVDAEGKLTPVKTADVITYKSESDAGFLVLPVAENNPVTYIHVAVPAGVYGELYVTLESADGVMYKSVKTDSTKPLNAGKVREFSDNIEFVPTDEAEVFVISNYGDLYEYKEAVEGGSTLGAVLVKDIEIPATNDVQLPAWAPINAPAYAATFNGNGYAINGLAKPLFDSVAATIKGVHLKDVKIAEEYTSANTGALVNTYLGESITHCSAEGTITLTRVNSVANKIGGLVGSVSNFTTNWEISDCVNNCAITVALTDAETKSTTFVGGIMGDRYDTATTGTTATLANNTNSAAISIKGAAGTFVVASGIVGRLHYCKPVLANCVNSNNISTELSSTQQVHITGILGLYTGAPKDYNITATDCYNTGNISTKLTTANTTTNYSSVAGCFGCINNTNQADISVNNCDNSGNIELDASSITVVNNQFHVAGIAGCLYGRVRIENCNNTGKYVKMTAQKSASRQNIAGVVGRLASRATDDRKNTTKNIIWAKDCTNQADIASVRSVSHSENDYIAGGFGSVYAYDTTFTTFTIDNVDNYGGVAATVNGYTGTSQRAWLGGIIGSTYMEGSNDNATSCRFTMNNCDNGVENTSKKITLSGDSLYWTYAGGVISYHVFPSTIENCSNHMSYECTAKTILAYYYYGGLTGKLTHNSATSTIKNFTNTGDIIVKGLSRVNGTENLTAGFSGVLGYVNKREKTTKLNLENIVNKGDITIGGATDDEAVKTTALCVAGINAQMDDYANSTYTFSGKNVNTGNINIVNTTVQNNAYYGGAIGLITKPISNIQSYCTINADITTSAEWGGALVGGNTGTTTHAITDCKIGGSINGTELTADTYMDNICGYNYATYTNIGLLNAKSEVEFPVISNK